MKQATLFTIFITLIAVVIGCTGGNTFHKTAMPNPQSYNAHFGDIDANGDEMVDTEEFKTFFPNAQPVIFNELDLNSDKNIDHDEWHQFKEAHGLKHKE